MKLIIFLLALFTALPVFAATPPGMKRAPRISVEPNKQHDEYLKNRGRTQDKASSRSAAQQGADAAAKSRVPVRPAPKQYMRAPMASEFVSVKNPAYTVLMPKSFGGDLLEGIIWGPMMIRGENDNLFVAVNIEGKNDPGYSTEPLPDFKGKKIYWTWTHVSAIAWNCSLSRYGDAAGRKIILDAKTQSSGNTFEVLYVFPAKEMYRYLPQALYSLNSFRLVKR